MSQLEEGGDMIWLDVVQMLEISHCQAEGEDSARKGRDGLEYGMLVGGQVWEFDVYGALDAPKNGLWILW